MAKAGIYIGSTQIHNVGLVTGDTYETVNAIKEQIQGKTGETYGNLSEAVQDVLAPYGNNENAVAKITKSNNTEVEYTSVYAALNDVISGETIQMIANSTETQVIVPEDVTLDLNGYVLTADSVSCFGDLIDSSPRGSKTGLLAIGEGKLGIYENTSMFPVYNGSTGYIFAEVKLQGKITAEETDSISLRFRPAFGEAAITTWMANNDNHGVKMMYRSQWNQDGNITYQNCYYSDEVVKNAYANGLMFTPSVSGISQFNDFHIEVAIESNTGAKLVQSLK